MSGGNLVVCCNIAEGVHGDGCITKLTDAALATRNVLVKIGSDISHVAVTTAGTEIPLGVVNDEASAAEENVNVQLLGQKQGTVLMVASAAITAGDLVVAAANGKIATLSASAGTYYIVGRALNAATTDGDLVEVAHCLPVQRVVSG
jgi:predicted RecA/RadA family phage recombinase